MDCLPACLVLIKPCPEKAAEGAGGGREWGHNWVYIRLGRVNSCQCAPGFNPNSGLQTKGRIHVFQLPGVTEKRRFLGLRGVGFGIKILQASRSTALKSGLEEDLMGLFLTLPSGLQLKPILISGALERC